MSARFGLRAIRAQFQQLNTRFTNPRMYSTAAEDAGIAQNLAKPEAGGFSGWFNGKIGPKTVHFWAPVMKWGLVAAGASDFTRPASELSLTQNAALMCTGLIWTRWCFVIRPKNVLPASVNFLLFCVGATQTGRVLSYQAAQKNKSIEGAAKDELRNDEVAVEKIVENPEGAARKIADGK